MILLCFEVCVNSPGTFASRSSPIGTFPAICRGPGMIVEFVRWGRPLRDPGIHRSGRRLPGPAQETIADPDPIRETLPTHRSRPLRNLQLLRDVRLDLGGNPALPLPPDRRRSAVARWRRGSVCGLAPGDDSPNRERKPARGRSIASSPEATPRRQRSCVQLPRVLQVPRQAAKPETRTSR